MFSDGVAGFVAIATTDYQLEGKPSRALNEHAKCVFCRGSEGANPSAVTGRWECGFGVTARIARTKLSSGAIGVR
jgi:hypothetical protein